ncbi:OmpA family protein [Portibacter marinus]|uniref:OmpA family protein n=1 Tax=Portibacter marinus TaxID=2898660 RepID=UPI001F46DAA5|nr:OmpA family protein [Portibacter marinus]
MKQILCLIFVTCSMLLQAQEGTPSVIRGSEQYSLTIKTYIDSGDSLVNDVDVYLFDPVSNDLLETKTTTDGEVTFEIDPQVEYEIRTCKEGFLKGGISIYECNEGDEVLCSFGADEYIFIAMGGEDKPIAYFDVYLALTPLKLGSVYELENVYYDLDESHLRPRGKDELDELAKIMKRNKSIKIELSSHTDSRASNEYNLELSQRRAESCYEYLVSQGISADRIIPKGYGETRLLNECSDGVECTEEQHQRNRRTEIEVLEYEPIECEPSLDVDFRVKDLQMDSDR